VADSEASKPKPKPNPELQQLQDLYDLMVQEGLETVELQDAGQRVKLERRATPNPGTAHPPVVRPASAAGAPPAPGEASANGSATIQTPLAGVFYRAASPTSPPFVKEGDVAEVGQTLCIVEAMKVMNEIKAENRCRIVKIVAENSRPVAAGQTLFLIESAS
jgi:acetyl-CoA carboxylase biotin carboxyl carrier protein